MESPNEVTLDFFLNKWLKTGKIYIVCVFSFIVGLLLFFKLDSGLCVGKKRVHIFLFFKISSWFTLILHHIYFFPSCLLID